MFGTSIYDQRHLDLKELIFKQSFWYFLACFHRDSDPKYSFNILFIVYYFTILVNLYEYHKPVRFVLYKTPYTKISIKPFFTPC